MGFLDPSPVSPRPPHATPEGLAPGLVTTSPTWSRRWVPGRARWRPFRARFAPDFAKTSFCENHNHRGNPTRILHCGSSQILKISHCKGAGPLDPRDIMPLLLLRALQGGAKGVAGLDLGLRDPPRRAGETASVVEPRYRSCDCFLERPRLRRRFLAAWPRFTSVFVDAHSARYRGLPRAWLGLIWAFVIRSEGPARQLV